MHGVINSRPPAKKPLGSPLTAWCACLNSGSSDTFTVGVRELEAGKTYLVELQVVAAADGLLGFNASCSSSTTSYDPTGTVPDLALHSCSPAAGVVHAVLKEDGAAVASSGGHIVVALSKSAPDDSQRRSSHVPQPVASVTNQPTNVDNGGSEEFTLNASNLIEGRRVGIHVTTGRDHDIRFNSACNLTGTIEEFQPQTGITSRSADFTVFGCAEGSGTVYHNLLQWRALPEEEDYVWYSLLEFDITVRKPAPPPPSNIRLTQDTSTSLAIAWDTRTGATEYRVRYSTDEVNWTTGDDSAATTFSASDLDADTIYAFQVQAKGNGITYRVDWGEWSDSVNISTPTIYFHDVDDPLEVGETDTFHVIVNKLNPERNYALSVWADRESGLGTRDASDTETKAALARANCSVKVLRQELEEQSQAYIWNLELRGCAVGEAGLTAYILDRTGRSNVSDYRQVARVDTSVTVEPAPPPPSIEITDLVSSMTEGESDAFTGRASNLDSSVSYTVRATTDNSDIGFNSSCSDRLETRNVTAGSTSYSASFTLHACDSTGGTVTVELRQGSTVVDSDTQTVTVEALPTVSIGLAQGQMSPVTEGRTLMFEVEADKTLAHDLDVNIAVTETGSFLDGVLPVQVTINATMSNAEFSVLTDHDDTDETDGYVYAMVKSGTGYDVGSPHTVTVEIEDNDCPAVAQPMISKHADLLQIGVAYSLPASSCHFRLILVSWQSGTFLDVLDSKTIPSSPGAATEHFRPNIGGSFRVGLEACRDSGLTDCHDPVYSTDSIDKLSKPFDFDVIPDPLDQRQAKLTWRGVGGADEYEIRQIPHRPTGTGVTRPTQNRN